MQAVVLGQRVSTVAETQSLLCVAVQMVKQRALCLSSNRSGQKP